MKALSTKFWKRGTRSRSERRNHAAASSGCLVAYRRPWGCADAERFHRHCRRGPWTRRRPLLHAKPAPIRIIPAPAVPVTLIEIEAIEALAREYDVHLAAGLARRNLVTRGVALNHLVGKIFAVGAVVLRGMRLCEPCLHLEKLAVKGAARGADSPRRAARRNRGRRRDSSRRCHRCR